VWKFAVFQLIMQETTVLHCQNPRIGGPGTVNRIPGIENAAGFPGLQYLVRTQ